MDWLGLFKKQPERNSALVAKERLQVIVAHRRAGGSSHPDYFPKLQEDLMQVIRKYVNVGDDAVQISLDRDETLDVLQLNISLPEKH